MIRALKVLFTSKDMWAKRARLQVVVLLVGWVLLSAGGLTVTFTGHGHGYWAGWFNGANLFWGIASLVWILLWSRDLRNAQCEHAEDIRELQDMCAEQTKALTEMHFESLKWMGRAMIEFGPEPEQRCEDEA